MAIVQLPDGRVVDTNQPVGPSAGEQMDWANQRAQIDSQLATAGLQRDYATGAAQSQYGVDQNTLAQKYAQMREKLPGGYAKRGLLNSGIYARGLQDYATDKANSYAKLSTAYQNQLGQIQTNWLGQAGNAISQKQSIDRAEAGRRWDLATSLRNMQ